MRAYVYVWCVRVRVYARGRVTTYRETSIADFNCASNILHVIMYLFYMKKAHYQSCIFTL